MPPTQSDGVITNESAPHYSPGSRHIGLFPVLINFVLLQVWFVDDDGDGSRDGPNVRAEAEGLGRLTERVPNVRPNFGRMLCARMKQRLLLVSALSGQKMS